MGVIVQKDQETVGHVPSNLASMMCPLLISGKVAWLASTSSRLGAGREDTNPIHIYTLYSKKISEREKTRSKD